MSICQDQDNFNSSFYKALQYSREKETKGMGIVLSMYLILHTIFIFWAVLLAFKQEPQGRIIHITLAIIFSPAYVISYYLNSLQ
jgi:succinate-acetate transporter protein